MRISYFLGLLLFGSFSAVANDNVAVTIYDEAGLGGESLEITGDTPYLGKLDKKMSSYQLNPGFEVRFFEGENFQGGYYSVNAKKNQSQLMAIIDNKIRSVKVLKYSSTAPAAGKIYLENNYSGSSYEIKGDMASLGNFSGKLGSFEIEYGYEIRFFEQENFQGGYYSKGSNANESAAPSWGNNVRSAQIIVENGVTLEKITQNDNSGGTEPPPEPTDPNTPTNPVIYTGTNGSGQSLTLTKSISQLNYDFSDKMSSFFIPTGWQLRFFEHADYQGASWIKDPKNTVQNVSSAERRKISSVSILKYPGGAPATTPKKPTLYLGRDATGTSFEYDSNTSSMPINIRYEFLSHYLPVGWQVKFYEYNNFQGDSWTIDGTGKYQNLESPIVNKVASIKVLVKRDIEEEIEDKFIVYAGTFLSGQKQEVTDDTKALNSGIRYKIGSYYLPKGWIVRFFQYQNYEGEYWTKEGNGAVNEADYYTQISSSVRILKSDKIEYAPVLYSDANLKGNKLVINQSINRLDSNMYDKISSYRFPEEWAIRFYELANYSGKSWVIDEVGVVNQVPSDMNNSVRSVKVLRSPTYKPSQKFIINNCNNFGCETLDVYRSFPTLDTTHDGHLGSFSIPAGWDVEFYGQTWYRGGSWRRQGPLRVDKPDGYFERSIKSIKIHSRP